MDHKVYQTPEIYNPKKELAVFLSYSIFFIFIVFLFSLLIKYHPLPLIPGAKFTEDFWYVFFIKIIFLLILPILIYLKLGYSFASLFTYKTGISVFPIMLAFIAGLILNVSYVKEIVPFIAWQNLPKILLGLMIPLICAAIPEEIFYRRILQTRIEKSWGWIAGILISSVLFSLFHFPSRFLLSSGVEGTAGDIQGILAGTLMPTFILGLILSVLWQKFRNIYILIALHFGIDLLPSIASFLGISK